MALSDVEAIVYAKNSDVISEAADALNRETDAHYRSFISKIYGGIFIFIAGVIVTFLPLIYGLPALIIYGGAAVIIVGLFLLAYSFKIPVKLKTADLKLYPILFAGFEHGEFFAIDPFGNGEDISLPYYKLDDLSKAQDILNDLESILGEAFRGELETEYAIMNTPSGNLIVSKPLAIIYGKVSDLVHQVSTIGVETRKYNMIMPEENEVPHELKIPLEKSGFTEEQSLKKIDLGTVEKLFDELVGTNRNWEEAVDRLKDIKEKYEPLHGQILSHYDWLLERGGKVTRDSLITLTALSKHICPHCLLSANYLSNPSYPAISLIRVKEEDTMKIYYQCSRCGYRVEADELLYPRESLSTSFIDDLFNEIWLGKYERDREQLNRIINGAISEKKKMLDELEKELSSRAGRLSEELEEIVSQVEERLMDARLYTDLLVKIGLAEAGEIYKSIYENANFIKQTLSQSPANIRQTLEELVVTRINPIIFNNTYLEKRVKAAQMLGREDVAGLIKDKLNTMILEEILQTYIPLLKEEEKEEVETQ